MHKDNQKNNIICFGIISLIFVLRIITIFGLTIYPEPFSACDDNLLVTWANSILLGSWKGSFNSYTFIKLPGFSIYLAFLYILKLPYLLTTNIIYLLGCAALVYSLSGIIKNRPAICVIYAVLAFNPVMASYDVAQRVYRNGFAVAVTVWFFASLFGLYFSLEKKWWKSMLWSVILFVSLGVLWITKEDSIWLLPVLLGVILASAIKLVKKHGLKAPVFRLLFYVLPFLGIFSFSGIVNKMNNIFYGVNNISSIDNLINCMKSVESGDRTELCSMPTSVLRKLCEASPTLAMSEAAILDQIAVYDVFDTNPTDGNIEDGWLGWAIMDGLQQAGFWRDAVSTDEYCRKACEELEQAFADDRLDRKRDGLLSSYHMDNVTECAELAATTLEAFNYVVGHKGLQARLFKDSVAMHGSNYIFATLTHEKLADDFEPNKASVIGWVISEDFELRKADVYIEDGIGNRYTKIKFKDSPDLQKLYPDIKGASKARFEVDWEFDAKSLGDTPFYLIIDNKGSNLLKLELSGSGIGWSDKTFGHIDTCIITRQKSDSVDKLARVVKRCNFIDKLYSAVMAIIDYVALLLFVIFCVIVLVKRKELWDDYGDSLLVAAGIVLSVIVLCVGIAVTELENCPAIKAPYLSAGYPLLDLFAVLMVVKFVQLIRYFKCKRK